MTTGRVDRRSDVVTGGANTALLGTMACVAALLAAKADPLCRTRRRRSEVTPMSYFDPALAAKPAAAGGAGGAGGAGAANKTSHHHHVAAYFAAEQLSSGGDGGGGAGSGTRGWFSDTDSGGSGAGPRRPDGGVGVGGEDDDGTYEVSALELAVMGQSVSVTRHLLAHITPAAAMQQQQQGDGASSSSSSSSCHFTPLVRTTRSLPSGLRKYSLGHQLTLAASNALLSDVVLMGSALWWHLLLSSTPRETTTLVNWDMPLWWWASDFANTQQAHVPADPAFMMVRA